MDKKLALDALRRFRLALESKGFRIQKLVLYGSYAQGKVTEGSDIDVLVIADDFWGKSYWERIEILSDAIYGVFEPVEAIALTNEEWEQGERAVVGYARNGEAIF
jgi:predicted nucleotidyltransferase